jgi:hypothetical protein
MHPIGPIFLLLEASRCGIVLEFGVTKVFPYGYVTTK